MKELFVYGTLKDGGKWHHLVENEPFVGNDAILGEMYLDAKGYYPIAFPGNDVIEGEVYNVGDEAYAKVDALESGADYYTAQVTSVEGRSVTVYLCNNDQAKVPERKIDNFDAPFYFQKWLSETDKDSPSYKEYIDSVQRSNP